MSQYKDVRGGALRSYAGKGMVCASQNASIFLVSVNMHPGIDPLSFHTETPVCQAPQKPHLNEGMRL